MGPVERTENDRQADRFFAGFANATPELVAGIASEQGGDLAEVVAEEKAFGYWDRKMAARGARRAARERAERVDQAERVAALDRTPDETARLAPLPAASAVILPEPRFVILTDPEHNETRQWWRHLDTPAAARSLARRIRDEARDAERRQRRTAREHAAWQQQQRAFERAQWRAVVANRTSRPQRKIANQWVAIDEDRALAIASAALQNTTPPQRQK